MAQQPERLNYEQHLYLLQWMRRIQERVRRENPEEWARFQARCRARAEEEKARAAADVGRHLAAGG